MALSSSQLRAAWKKFECKKALMERIAFGGDSILVAPGTEDAWRALYQVFHHHGYRCRLDDTDSYNCRAMKNGKTKSLHSFGIALDVNWHTNPYIDHAGTRKVRYSDGADQDARARDVKLGRADTDMTPQIIQDVEQIATVGGEPVFEWGGRWNSIKDAMHFQIKQSPGEMSSGIDWSTVAGDRVDDETTDQAGGDVEEDVFGNDDDTFNERFNDIAGNDDDEGVLSYGARGAMVKALQQTLNRLGYFIGDEDSIFGRLTRDGVLAFQADKGIEATGLYDAETAEALKTATERPIAARRLRTTEKELVQRGSQTMRTARWNRWLGIGTAILGALGVSDKHLGYVNAAANALKGTSEAVKTGDAGTIFNNLLQNAEALNKATGNNSKVGEILAKINEVKDVVASTATNSPPPQGGGILESVISLGQGLLSGTGYGLPAMLAGAGLMIWRNANSASRARLNDHRTAANRHR